MTDPDLRLTLAQLVAAVETVTPHLLRLGAWEGQQQDVERLLLRVAEARSQLPRPKRLGEDSDDEA